VLRASASPDTRLVAVCVDDKAAADLIVDLVRIYFPAVKLYVRSYDRRHSLELLAKDVDFEMRETFESALLFGRKTLEALGLTEERVEEIDTFIRTRDRDRLALQQAEGILGGLELLRSQPVTPEPLSKPQRAATALNPEAEEIIEKKPAAE